MLVLIEGVRTHSDLQFVETVAVITAVSISRIMCFATLARIRITYKNVSRVV